jgi:hypothetical protein
MTTGSGHRQGEFFEMERFHIFVVQIYLCGRWRVDTHSDIPICVAAKNGHIEAVRLLNELEADVEKSDEDVLTALEWAACAAWHELL